MLEGRGHVAIGRGEWAGIVKADAEAVLQAVQYVGGESLVWVVHEAALP